MSDTEPHFSITTSGRWTPQQLDALSDAHNRLARALEGYTPANGDGEGHSTLIAGNRALLAIGAVVLIALLLHTIFWSFVLPLGAIA